MLIDDPKRTNVLEDYIAQYNPKTFFKNAQKRDLKTAFQEDWEMTKEHLAGVLGLVGNQANSYLARKGMEILGLQVANDYARAKGLYQQKK